MRTAAIIAEYNPFHNGHKYHIEQTRRLYGATHIAAVMSGCFCQRGDCAIAFKNERVRMALYGGCDLVLELPLPWALASAERFAYGGAFIADALGCVDMLSFGSESGELSTLKDIARALEEPSLGALLAEADAKCGSFAKARQQAVARLLGDEKKAALLENPNDNLGVEYIKALDRLGSATEPVCVVRQNAHDGEASASHIRALLLGEGLDACAQYLPASSERILREAINSGSAPASLSRCDRAVLYKCRTMSAEEFAELPEVSGGLENRLFTCSRNAQSAAHYADLVKNKSVAHSRIRRAICSAFLGLSARECEGAPPYIRVLGMNARGREMLSAARPRIPVISRYSDVRSLEPRSARVFELEQYAADCFGLCTPEIQIKGLDNANKLTVL